MTPLPPSPRVPWILVQNTNPPLYTSFLTIEVKGFLHGMLFLVFRIIQFVASVNLQLSSVVPKTIPESSIIAICALLVRVFVCRVRRLHTIWAKKTTSE